MRARVCVCVRVSLSLSVCVCVCVWCVCGVCVLTSRVTGFFCRFIFERNFIEESEYSSLFLRERTFGQIVYFFNAYCKRKLVFLFLVHTRKSP